MSQYIKACSALVSIYISTLVGSTIVDTLRMSLVLTVKDHLVIPASEQSL